MHYIRVGDGGSEQKAFARPLGSLRAPRGVAPYDTLLDGINKDADPLGAAASELPKHKDTAALPPLFNTVLSQ